MRLPAEYTWLARLLRPRVAQVDGLASAAIERALMPLRARLARRAGKPLRRELLVNARRVWERAIPSFARLGWSCKIEDRGEPACHELRIAAARFACDLWNGADAAGLAWWCRWYRRGSSAASWPDGDAGRDVYAVLREAIAKTGKVALSRVVISQRERTIALRPADGGLMLPAIRQGRRRTETVPHRAEPVFHVRRDRPTAVQPMAHAVLPHRQPRRQLGTRPADRLQRREHFVAAQRDSVLRPAFSFSSRAFSHERMSRARHRPAR